MILGRGLAKIPKVEIVGCLYRIQKLLTDNVTISAKHNFPTLKNNKTYVIFLTVSIFFLILLGQNASALPADVKWGSIAAPAASVSIEDGDVLGVNLQILFEVQDDDLIGGPLSTITVTITTTSDPVGVTVTLNEDALNNGRFTNTNFIFMENNARFTLSDTATITVEDPNCTPGPCDPFVRDLLVGGGNGVLVVSETDNAGISMTLTETDLDSKIFTDTLSFTTGGSIANPPTLKVASGDVITVYDEVTGYLTNGIILPIPIGKGAILASAGDSTTITYMSTSDGIKSHTITVTGHPGPGRGGGGLVAPGLVVDVIASITGSGGGSGCKNECTPPTLGLDKNSKRIVSNGFSYNGNPVDVELFYTHYPLIIVSVGQQNEATLKIYENSGYDDIEHVGLAFGLGKNQYFSESKAAIYLNRNEGQNFTVTTHDPENVLQDVSTNVTTARCSDIISEICLVVSILHTFRDKLDFNMVATQVWDKNRNSWQNFYNDGVQIVGDSLNPPKKHIGLDRGRIVEITETEKNTAIDEQGNLWRFDKSWTKEYIPPIKVSRYTSHGLDRYDIGFHSYMKEQESIAMQKITHTIHNSSSDQLTVIKSTHFTIDEDTRKKELEQRIRIEIARAEKYLQELLQHE